MCNDCGCGDTDKVSVEIHESLLAGNALQAAHNRQHFAARGMLAIPEARIPRLFHRPPATAAGECQKFCV